MPSIELLLTFSLACILLSLSPGPSNLYIMARSLSQGHQAGIAAAGGLAIGSLTYVVATALGLAAVFKYSPLAYIGLKLAGAAYLVYLGFQYLRAKPADIDTPKPLRHLSVPTIFRQSLVVELTNPKTALFFLAFLPQFVRDDAGSVTSQLLVLGLVYALIALCCDLLVAMLSHKLGKWLAGHSSFAYWQDKLSGGILLALAAFIVGEELQNTSQTS
ncbi:LysE family translocator [Aliiglaciecola sp. CAU 1673]|uniref:LysE family translocator n=1 Tax=Aliiglaciecola sp. CAU 1673 TaxID=3032595 RepID=UPI0023DC1F6F|nr:LysE family translocator [Aliiglaciecola sp. CAU 1673]MDF2178984.1 LysE family translocator [Aliiglaciecola sp. CAU 1673]